MKKFQSMFAKAQQWRFDPEENEEDDDEATGASEEGDPGTGTGEERF